VSIDDERDLHEQLDRALEAITPGPAPVDGAVRRGQTIRRWRRATAAAGLAAAVAAGVMAVPPLRHAALPPSPAAGHYTVTLQPPGRHAPAGEIASGTINGQQWRIAAPELGAGGAARGLQAILASGPGAGPGGMAVAVPPLAANRADPVSWQGLGSSTAQGQFGAVRADVWYVTIRLRNGTVLTLHPVTVNGTRAVAFAVPLGAAIADATAYSRHGEIATAIPFNKPGGMAFFAAWLKPGQPGLGRVSGRIGSGTFDGNGWSATAYLGPWGVCVETEGGGVSAVNCTPATSALGTGILFWTGDAPQVAGGSASAPVARVVVHRVGGTIVQVRPVTVGRQKFFAFPMGGSYKPLTWKAYDRSGKLVASSAN
jgi:hypothetical protein